MARTGVERGETSLDAAMRQPAQQPDVVVLDFVEGDVKVKDTSDPKKDLYLSTNDGFVVPSLFCVFCVCTLQLNRHSFAPRAFTWPTPLYLLRF
jgi:hypothetical protein